MLLLIALLSALYGHGWQGMALPNPTLTPGDVALTDAAKVCGTAWGADVRHVTQAMKIRVCQRYGARGCPSPAWELDHLVSRELGGADTERNLWAQPIREARKKDRLENYLHRRVCGGFMTLEAAQETIRADWTDAYRRYISPEMRLSENRTPGFRSSWLGRALR